MWPFKITELVDDNVTVRAGEWVINAKEENLKMNAAVRLAQKQLS